MLTRPKETAPFQIARTPCLPLSTSLHRSACRLRRASASAARRNTRRKGRMSRVQPMLATAGTLPTGPGWAYEFKWDGVRTLVDSSTSGLTLTSRLGNDVTVAYPELAGLAGVAEDVLLDGEVVSLVNGRPSFSTLQNRMHVRKSVEARRLAAAPPVTYLAFDVLRLYGVDLTGRPFSERR